MRNSFVSKEQESDLKSILLVKPENQERLSLDPVARWEGSFIDTGAQTTVIGLKQALAYCKYIGIKFQPNKSSTKFRFGDSKCKSLGIIPITVPFTENDLICSEVDVVSANVPFLVGLDLLGKQQLFVNNISNELCVSGSNIKLPLIRKRGHIYFEWDKQIRYTYQELVKLHRAFSHPASDKLFSLLKLARPWEKHQAVREALDLLSKRCNVCQRFSNAPIRFRVSLPTEKNLLFGEELSMDLMFLHGRDVLHVTDTATHYSAATFLDSAGASYGQFVEGIWEAFLNTWCTMYIGYPNRLRTGQGSVFTSNR